MKKLRTKAEAILFLLSISEWGVRPIETSVRSLSILFGGGGRNRNTWASWIYDLEEKGIIRFEKWGDKHQMVLFPERIKSWHEFRPERYMWERNSSLLRVMGLGKLDEPKMQAPLTDDVKLIAQDFEDFYNMTWKNHMPLTHAIKLNDTSYALVAKAVFEGKTAEQLRTAVSAAFNDEFHASLKWGYLTPEYILRPDRLDRLCNM